MNIWLSLLPLLIGFVGIMQGTLNKQVAGSIGVAQATLITNTVTTVICIVFYFLVKSAPEYFPDIFHVKAPILTYKWWFLFPPLFGFIIIAGMPFALSKLGAVKVTVLLVAAQMITSSSWDYFIDHIDINIYKIMGMICAFLSVVFIALSKT